MEKEGNGVEKSQAGGADPNNLTNSDNATSSSSSDVLTGVELDKDNPLHNWLLQFANDEKDYVSVWKIIVDVKRKNK